MIEQNNNFIIEIENNDFIFYEEDKIKGSIQIVNNNPSFKYFKISLIQEQYFSQQSSNKKIERSNCLNTKTIEMVESKKYYFILEIPKSINPSFEFPGINFNLYIRYYLKFEYLSNNYVNKKLIIIRSVNKFSSSIFMQFGGSVHKLLFINYGNCDASIKMQRDNFKMGEYIYFSLNINNQTSIKVNKVKINLIREINIKDVNVNEIIKEEHLLTRSNIKWIVPNHSQSECNFRLKLKDNELKYVNLQNWNFDYKNDMNIQDLLCSVSSELFECKYHLKVTVYFSSFVKYNSRPRVLIPFNVCHKTSEELEEEKKIEMEEGKKIYNKKILDLTDISSIIVNKDDKDFSNFIDEEIFEEDDLE